MQDFDDELNERLTRLRDQDLIRQVRPVHSPQSTRCQIDGESVLNFSSNDYLGLANHPLLKDAATQAVEDYGAGSGSSRLICGSLKPHHDLEENLAAFKDTQGAIAFSSGYATAIGTIGALAGIDDVIAIDRLVHASIVDAARLSGAKLRVFAHNDLNALEKILRWADQRRAGALDQRRSRTLIVTESVFSMDGDHAPLRELVELKDRYGAWLMVDEAHAAGLYGAQRRGLAEQNGVSHRIEVQMGTLGKAIGAAGGYICGSRTLIDFLVNRARSFIFSTAPVPAAAAAASAGIRLIQSSEGERLQKRLWKNVGQFSTALRPAGSGANKQRGHLFAIKDQRSAIVPIIVGAEQAALRWAERLREQSIFVPAIRYPTVARGQARLRVTFTAAHASSEIDVLTEALRSLAAPKDDGP